MKPKYINLIDSNNEILCKDIYDWEGCLLVGKNTTINPYIISTLEKCKITKIPVYPSRSESHSWKSQNSKVTSKENVFALKDLMNSVVAGESVEIEKIKVISNTFCERIANNEPIIDQIRIFKSEDNDTYKHSLNVAFYSFLIAKWIGLNENEMEKVVIAGLLHDIGKSKIPSEIINKKGKLTPEEFEVVKTHSSIGYEMSATILNINEDVRHAILLHHERVDGSGYPYGLKGEEINIFAKILAIADVYDALTSERVYKNKSTPFEAIEEFHMMGLYSFDTRILDIFFNNIINYYVNAKVKTNIGEIGEIVFIPPNDITKPVIRLENAYIELSNSDIKILEIVS
ncbi:HD-GYP domain-containing protein [Anaerosalibacter sp. Marseille-P3206]|uniref:HD-GYP domain-containing protein n=1 Tax=Anaerosalibacter sp. Marseille-P3206 TaxID=1871005 RepID=UPI0009859853|nr:HD-GYP domain-containing protein [Anaerosalibacter sp. Marseille-P3206]